GDHAHLPQYAEAPQAGGACRRRRLSDQAVPGIGAAGNGGAPAARLPAGLGAPTRARPASAGVAYGDGQLVLAHPAAADDAKLTRAVVQLLPGALLQPQPRVAGALGAGARSAPFLPPLLVDRPARHFLGALLAHSALCRALLDVLVLTPVLVAPGWHSGLLVS